MSCSVNKELGLVAAHLSLHNDFKLVKLGRDYGFPRGFCVVVDISREALVGQGTFYPKFANDDRNSSFSAKDFGGVSKISCFLKYSGSTGIISIIRDDKGDVIGWTGSSKKLLQPFYYGKLEPHCILPCRDCLGFQQICNAKLLGMVPATSGILAWFGSVHLSGSVSRLRVCSIWLHRYFNVCGVQG